jgi:catechol 2,3-dioxygenase-like lactoylglutathione lyase family enzyme
MGARSRALSHVAMSVPTGTLTDEHRAALLDFYGRILGWREIEQLRLPDRMTIAVGRDAYVNLRERDDPAAYQGYDHFGLLVDSEAELRELWAELDRDPEVELRAISEAGATLTFRFRYLLPQAVEVQYFGGR